MRISFRDYRGRELDDTSAPDGEQAVYQAMSLLARRHRLNPGGDRQANAALYLIAVCRLRYCERTRAYTARRTAQGRSKREIVRCLKRYIAREVYHTLRADLSAYNASTAATATPPTPATSDGSSAC